MILPYSFQQLKEKLTPIFRENKVHKAILFGSYSKNQASSTSDVDIFVDSGLHGIRFFGLLEDVCSALECKVDLIDSKDIIPGSPIEQEIKRTGVLLYEH